MSSGLVCALSPLLGMILSLIYCIEATFLILVVCLDFVLKLCFSSIFLAKKCVCVCVNQCGTNQLPHVETCKPPWLSGRASRTPLVRMDIPLHISVLIFSGIFLLYSFPPDINSPETPSGNFPGSIPSSASCASQLMNCLCHLMFDVDYTEYLLDHYYAE